MFTISWLRSIENKHDVYRDKDYMKKFCDFLRKDAIKVINKSNNINKIINKRSAGII